ncbi:hypothetical protein niasHS_005478 [Heterodera schachtii]|uniref:Triacylglycerol lipase n=1 Tax=Heterodera schachtii TaxID=97005 RepID=A0ABD2JIX1_HETSC
MNLALFVTICQFLLLFFGTFPPTHGTISTAFSQFLLNSFNDEVEKNIARRDLGTDGSFGGGKGRFKAKKRPVIFVHGLTNLAGELDYVRRQFREKGGYRDSELYATTYGYGMKGWKWLRDAMKCDHVKKIRIMIRAITQFTHSSQAILGGVCVDTGEQLGPPLTHLVHTFIGVGGANREAVHLCRLFEWAMPCNPVNGMRCHSQFLDDINSKVGYEATTRIFVIRSMDDGTVGTRDCEGRSVSAIDGQNDEIVLRNYSHQMVIFGTGEQQLKLLTF